MDLIGQHIGPYRILRALGAGGMGEVFLALDSRLERQVALKRLPAEFSSDAEQLARFRREALTLAAMNHPNIATIHGFEEPGDGELILVLEYVEGESLAERLRRGSLTLLEGLRVCAQVAEALEVAHERGVIHRDIKPGNIMLGPRGLVKVLDFGLAKHSSGLLGSKAPAEADSQGAPAAPAPVWRAEAAPPGSSMLTGHGAVVGTPGYMSPEQVLAGAQDERTDIFAFGCVLYECLSGKRAFEGRDDFEVMAAILSAGPDVTQLPTATPERIRRLLEQCLEKDGESRLGEIRTARLEIEEALGIRRASALRTGEEAAAVPHNLPSALTSFVGRESAIAECARLLAENRLLTLTGMGGCGKTRLALKVAESRLARHPDGVWFVDLAPLAEPARVPEVVAAALQVREEPGRPIHKTLAAHLASKRALLVLDNCEHVIEACAAMATELLAAAPELRLVATSREALGVTGETLLPVPPLKVPAKQLHADPAAMGAIESVRLFVERAAAVQSGFELTGATAAVVAEICRRLDGIPLAIELAAARARVLGLDQIQSRLDDRFRLLTGGSRAALPRQQTLRATIQWSYDLLVEREQQMMCRLAVFAGGWTLEQATAVFEEQADEFEVLDLLTCLVDKSLVLFDRSGKEPRYRFLESVRQFAHELLGPNGDGAPVRGRHLDFFLRFAEESERFITGPEQARWLDMIAVEEENLLAALAYCPGAKDGPEKGLRLVCSACRFWSARAHYETGRRALEEALRLDASRVGGEAQTTPEAPLAEADRPTAPSRAMALVRAGAFALFQGDYAAARPRVEQSLRLYRALDDRKGIARALLGASVVAIYQGDHQVAREATEESLALYRELEQPRGVAQALHNLGYLAWCRSDLPAARGYYEQALSLLEQIGDRESIALTLSAMGSTFTRLGDAASARRHFYAALELVQELAARREAADAIEGIAELAEAGGQLERAARLCGAAVAIRRAIGSPLVPGEERERQALLQRLTAKLGQEEYGKAVNAGQLMALPEAIKYALEALAETSGFPQGEAV